MRQERDLELNLIAWAGDGVAAETRSVFAPARVHITAVLPGVRSGRGIDARVRTIPLELVASPIGRFPTTVLGDGHRNRLGLQRLFHSADIEPDLHHVPVGFVPVVEAVEDVIEPVLNHECVAGRCHDVGIGHRCVVHRYRIEPLLVAASGMPGISGKIEVIPGSPREQVARLGSAAHDRICGCRASRILLEHHIAIAEHHVRRHRKPRFTSVIARCILLFQHNARRVSVGEFLFRGNGRVLGPC